MKKNNFNFKVKHYALTLDHNFTCNQNVSIQSFALLRWAVPVALTSFRYTDHLKPKLRAVMKNNSPFLLSTLPIFTRSLIAFVRAT